MKNYIKVERKLINILAMEGRLFDCPKRVLVVDDNRSFAKFMKYSLEKIEDLDVSYYFSAKSAIVGIMEHRPDLIVLDINLPDINGFKIASMVNEIYNSSIPILFVSANSSYAGEVDYFNNEFPHKFLAKPIDRNNLENNVKELLFFKKSAA